MDTTKIITNLQLEDGTRIIVQDEDSFHKRISIRPKGQEEDTHLVLNDKQILIIVKALLK